MTYETTSQESTSKWGIGYDGNTEFTRCFQNVDFRILNIKREWRILDLYCCDRMDGMCTTKGGSRTLGKANTLDFTFSIRNEMFPSDVFQ